TYLLEASPCEPRVRSEPSSSSSSSSDNDNNNRSSGSSGVRSITDGIRRINTNRRRIESRHRPASRNRMRRGDRVDRRGRPGRPMHWAEDLYSSSEPYDSPREESVPDDTPDDYEYDS